jgi:hypothetical protein
MQSKTNCIGQNVEPRLRSSWGVVLWLLVNQGRADADIMVIVESVNFSLN